MLKILGSFKTTLLLFAFLAILLATRTSPAPEISTPPSGQILGVTSQQSSIPSIHIAQQMEDPNEVSPPPKIEPISIKKAGNDSHPSSSAAHVLSVETPSAPASITASIRTPPPHTAQPAVQVSANVNVPLTSTSKTCVKLHVAKLVGAKTCIRI